jgi:hypothetical protein
MSKPDTLYSVEWYPCDFGPMKWEVVEEFFDLGEANDKLTYLRKMAPDRLSDNLRLINFYRIVEISYVESRKELNL